MTTATAALIQAWRDRAFHLDRSTSNFDMAYGKALRRCAGDLAGIAEPDSATSAITALTAYLHDRLAHDHRFVRIGDVFAHLAPALEVTATTAPETHP